MKFKVTLSQLPTLPPIRGELTLPITDIDQTYTLTYNLTKNCSTTDKFIDLWRQTVLHGISCSYNFYPTIDENMFIGMKKRMNWIIETIKTMDEIPNVDESLVLDVKSLDREQSKLNALHLYFEDVSNMPEIRLSAAYSNHEEVYIYLEEINQLVHLMEKRKEGEVLDFESMMVIRINPNKGSALTMMLTDEDYNNFRVCNAWGDLILDYNRVGKDLLTACTNNDVELVKTKGLCQQNTVHTCFDLEFREDTIDAERHYSVLRAWCHKNNVRDYYDTTLPMFNLGRVVLGKIDMTDTTQEEMKRELSKCTGVTNVELIDE